MTLVLVTLAVILTTHFFGIFSPYPVSLTAGHCHSFWPTYIYGDFVHMNYYHLVTDAVAFIVIYCLSPVDSIYRTGKYAITYVILFLAMNTLISWFVMSRFYPDGPVGVYYGISAAEFAMLFMIGFLWLYRKPAWGAAILVVASLLVAMPFIMNGTSTSGLLARFLDYIGVDHNLGHVAIWAHLTGAALGVPSAALMKLARSS
ncbi:MAG: rhomboid family intramembrane serine protease [Succinivibrionaceae bacterium]|nr:rhomboid family intramembrane serine protease [Succinivibrionaceae bacterium]